MPFYPMLAAGMLIAGDAASKSIRFTGTCASYLRRDIFITAAHCTNIVDGETLLVKMQAEEATRLVRRSVRHPRSDVALVFTEFPESQDGLGNMVYKGISDQLIDGGDFIGFGYPVEGSVDTFPVPRLFKGHFQRTFGYQAPSGGEPYFAAELSIPAPGGFSGGPLSWASNPEYLSAIVTTNHDSYALLDRLEEVEKGGTVYREQISRVVSYGIAAVLVGGLENWITEQIEAYCSEES